MSTAPESERSTSWSRSFEKITKSSPREKATHEPIEVDLGDGALQLRAPTTRRLAGQTSGFRCGPKDAAIALGVLQIIVEVLALFLTIIAYQNAANAVDSLDSLYTGMSARYPCEKKIPSELSLELYEQCELGGACVIGFSTSLDDTNASACGVATSRMRRQDELPACVCRESWTSDDGGSCGSPQQGCPNEACDGFGESATWCSVANSPCREEELDDDDDDYDDFPGNTPPPSGNEWAFCTPDTGSVSAANAADFARNSHFYVAGGGGNCEAVSPSAVLGVGWNGSRPQFAPGAKVFAQFSCRANGSELLDLDAADDGDTAGKDGKRSRARRHDGATAAEGNDAVTNAAKAKIESLLADDLGLSSSDVQMYAALLRDATAKAARPDAASGPAKHNGGAGTNAAAERIEVADDDDADKGWFTVEVRDRRDGSGTTAAPQAGVCSLCYLSSSLNFCNMEDGPGSGSCESCADVPDVTACSAMGLPAAGVVDCTVRCFPSATPAPEVRVVFGGGISDLVTQENQDTFCVLARAEVFSTLQTVCDECSDALQCRLEFGSIVAVITFLDGSRVTLATALAVAARITAAPVAVDIEGTIYTSVAADAAATTPSQTPGDTGNGNLVVTAGTDFCRVVGDCVWDGADNYGNNEDCTILVQTTGAISSTDFDTEANHDYITIGDRRYTGNSGPNDVAVFQGSTFGWHSDASVSASGWRLCWAAASGNSTGCAAHSSCSSDQGTGSVPAANAAEYCNDANECSPCDSCGRFNDAVDGTCPSHCGVGTVTGSDASIRLAAGDGVLSGRLEVNIGGQWGTVCDDDFGSVAAAIACRQLGLSGGTAGTGSRGSGGILMDDVRCQGDETRIQSCPFESAHNCDHSEDVFITCLGADATASPTQPAAVAVCGDTDLFANLYQAGEMATWRFSSRTAILVTFSTCATEGQDTVILVDGVRYDSDQCGNNEITAIAVAANEVVSVGVRFYAASAGRVFLAAECSELQAPTPAPTRRFFVAEDDDATADSGDSTAQSLSAEAQLAQCQASAFVALTGNLSRIVRIPRSKRPDKVIRRDASFVDIEYFTDPGCTNPLKVDDRHYTERHTWDTSPINMPHVALGPPLGVFCSGYAAVGQFRRAVDENDKSTCTSDDVRNKRNGCIQLINPLSGKYWYDTAYAACKNPGKCDSRKNDIVKQSQEVREMVILAKDGLGIGTIAQSLAIVIAFFLHFVFETLCGGNVFKTRATWIFFILKNAMVVVAFAANLFIGVKLLTATVESADGLSLREWLSNFIVYECFDASGTIVLTEVRTFVEDTATEMILVACIILIDGFIEDNISIVIEGSRDKRVKKMETVYKVVKAASIRRSASLSEALRPSDRASEKPDISDMLINNAAFSDAVMDDVLYEGNEPTGFGMAGGHVNASDMFEFAVGDRVCVGKRGRGAVLFAGMHQKNDEPRYGIRLDEPAGKNDGTVDGHQYFKCEPSHGVLVKPDKVTADPFA